MNTTLATLVVAVASAAATVAAEAAPTSPASTLGSAIVVQDQASLRAAPRDGAQQQTVLWQGEVLEVRGERLDYLQVWDHKRERGGFKSGVHYAPAEPAQVASIRFTAGVVAEFTGDLLEALAILHTFEQPLRLFFLLIRVGLGIFGQIFLPLVVSEFVLLLD